MEPCSLSPESLYVKYKAYNKSSLNIDGGTKISTTTLKDYLALHVTIKYLKGARLKPHFMSTAYPVVIFMVFPKMLGLQVL